MMIIQVALLLLTFTMHQPDDLRGLWQAPAEMEHALVKIYRAKNGFYYGKITACDRQEWVGKVVLEKFAYDPETNTWVGTIHALKRKMTIDGVLSLEANEQLKLVGSKLWMTKTFYWTRSQAD